MVSSAMCLTSVTVYLERKRTLTYLAARRWAGRVPCLPENEDQGSLAQLLSMDC